MRRRSIGLMVTLFILVMGIAGAYIVIGAHYQTHFFENASINGIDVSDLTASEAERLIARQAENYQLSVVGKDGNVEVIPGDVIGYRFVSKGEVQHFLDTQDILMWLPSYLGQKHVHTMKASVTWDASMLSQAAGTLRCMQDAQTVAPQDAYITRLEDGTFSIVPEQAGSRFDTEKAQEMIREAVEQGSTSVELTSAQCEELPVVSRDDEKLVKEAEARNHFSTMTITYDLGNGITEVLSPETIYSWFSLTEDAQVTFDYEQVSYWVNQLADKYDTIGRYLPFVTRNGETVYPESRTYGWQMDRDGETDALYQLLLAGESTVRSPIWLETAAYHGENDLGNTYVEIDYTNQHMWYYKDGILLVDTPVVTGNVSAGNASPEGVFCLVGKEENAVLVGEDYKTPVNYWMPFYGGVGIHDADSWRTTYGGDIYQYSGSHGCINTPTAQAAIIFEHIEAGTPIVCYSSGNYYGYDQVTVDGTAPIPGGTVSGDTQSTDIVIFSSDSYTLDNSQNYGMGDGLDIQMPDNTWDQQEENGYSEYDFPITLEDDWADESAYDQGEVIY